MVLDSNCGHSDGYGRPKKTSRDKREQINKGVSGRSGIGHNDNSVRARMLKQDKFSRRKMIRRLSL